MKLTGLGAIACAAMLTMACADRDARDEDADRTAALGTAGDNDDLDDRDADDEARLGTSGDRQARMGSGLDSPGMGMPGSVGTSGQSHGPDNAHDFMRKAAMHGNAEVQLGQLAAERAQSQDVKAFAQLMVRDHTTANNELKQAVTGQDVEIAPAMDEKQQQLIARLRNLRGPEFDREYMKAMVEAHTEAKTMLETRATGGRTARTATGTSGVATGGSQLENAINQWASTTLPTVEQHLQRAEQINMTLGNSGAATGDSHRR